MKTLRKILAGLLALTMLTSLGGCESKKTAENAQTKNTVSTENKKGGYVEEDVGVGSVMWMSDIVRYADGISFFDMSECKLYRMGIGDNEFHAEKSALEDKLKSPSLIIRDVSVGPNGDYYAAYSEFDDTNEISLYIDKDGNECTIDRSSMTDLLVSSKFSDDGRLFVRTFNTIYEVNTSSGTLKEIMSTETVFGSFDIVKERIIAVADDQVFIYDHKNEKEEEVPDILSKFFLERVNGDVYSNTQFNICAGEDDSMYIACRDGIFRYAEGSNRIEQIIDGLTTDLGNSDYYANGIEIDDEGSIYVSFMEGEIRKYYYDPELAESADVTLKIYALEDNETLSKAVNLFSKENRDVKIDYQIGTQNGMTYSDAMQSLTTQILSGNAPDVIMLDGLDIDNLIEKNMLADLCEFENSWNNNGELVDNIVKWNTADEKLYSVACKFRVPGVAADKEALKDINSYSDIADFVEKSRSSDKDGDFTIIDMPDPEWAVKNALIYTAGDIISDSGINKDELTKMYEDCRRVFVNDTPNSEKVSDIAYGYESVSYEYDLVTRFLNAIGEPGAIAVGTYNTFDFDYNTVTSVDKYEGETNISARLGLSDDQRTFLPTCNLAVTETSGNKEAAFKFIDLALSDELQRIPNPDGFPVNRSTLGYFYDQHKDPNSDGFVSFAESDGTTTFRMNVEWIDSDEAKEFDDYINSLDTPLTIDSEVKDIIVSAGVRCLEGTISPSQAADEAIAQLDLKMKE